MKLWLPAILLFSTIITVIVGMAVLSKFHKQNAMLNEYEFLLADCYSENQYLKDRLGCFYMPKEKR